MPHTPLAFHWILDPLCGWSYAAAPLLETALTRFPGCHTLHFGGLFHGPSRRPVDDSWRSQVLIHDDRIASLSGQPFGDAYRNELLRDSTWVLDSLPAIRRVLAIQTSAGADTAGRAFNTLQQGYYVDGRNITREDVLDDILTTEGLWPDDARQALEEQTEAGLLQHLATTRQRLVELGGQGYPTLALAHSGRPWQRVRLPNSYASPQGWQLFMNELPSQ